MKFQPLGDQAVLISCADESAAQNTAAGIRRLNPNWLVDIVTAYTDVAVFYDGRKTNYRAAAGQLNRVKSRNLKVAGKLHEIPCCYELGLDLAPAASHLGISPDEVIQWHISRPYSVYAIGFCPGFPYLGYLPDELCGVPRLAAPRLRVESGSVGITGRQTGIYPSPHPGGWHLIGRTPLELVALEDEYFPLHVGDQVRFVRVGETEFKKREGERL
jgi:inhibitor of KinA